MLAKVSRTTRPPSCASFPERCAISATRRCAGLVGHRGGHLLRRAGDERRLLDLLLGAGDHLLVLARMWRLASTVAVTMSRTCTTIVRMFATAMLKPWRSWPISSSLDASSSTERSPEEKRLMAGAFAHVAGEVLLRLAILLGHFGEVRVDVLEARPALALARTT